MTIRAGDYVRVLRDGAEGRLVGIYPGDDGTTLLIKLFRVPQGEFGPTINGGSVHIDMPVGAAAGQYVERLPDAADDMSTIIRTPDTCARVAWPQG